jgi:dephospho-CoA kinase
MIGLPARRLGLTGGIGSGKSTVAAMLAALGATVIDSDAIARAVTAPGGAALPRIRAEFGGSCFTPEGFLDREVMRQQVFNDTAARLRLEAIIHPMVASHTASQALDAEAGGAACLVFDVPLLVESGRWRQQVHQVLVVDCLESTQQARVMARNGWSREIAEQVMAGQVSRAERLAAADICLYNEGISLADLKVLVEEAANRFGL